MTAQEDPAAPAPKKPELVDENGEGSGRVTVTISSNMTLFFCFQSLTVMFPLLDVLECLLTSFDLNADVMSRRLHLGVKKAQMCDMFNLCS